MSRARAIGVHARLLTGIQGAREGRLRDSLDFVEGRPVYELLRNGIQDLFASAGAERTLSVSGGALALPAGPFGALDSGGLHPRTIELINRVSWAAIAAAVLALTVALFSATSLSPSIPVANSAEGYELASKSVADARRGGGHGSGKGQAAARPDGAVGAKAAGPAQARSTGSGAAASKRKTSAPAKPAAKARAKPKPKPAPAAKPAPPPAVGPVAGAFTFGDGLGAPRAGHLHSGVDLLAPAGTPLAAVASGQVVLSGWTSGGGNTIVIYDPNIGRSYVYMHLNAPAAYGVGASVERGAIIGQVGCTGTCSGDHLHFEVRGGSGLGGPIIDPVPLINSRNFG